MASATDDPIDSIDDDQVSDDQVSDDHGSDVGGANTADAGGKDSGDDSGPEDAVDSPDLLEREGEAAADYLEGLLDIIDVDGDIDMDVDGDRAVVAVIGEHLRHLVGQGGSVLDALQELTRLAVARETGNRSRLMLDVAGYRARRRAELAKIGTQAAEKATSTGESVALNPMSAFERKVVHDAVAAAGLRSESEGVEPERYVVVLPTRRDPTPEVAAATPAPNADGDVGEPVASPAAAATDESHAVTGDE